jgi:hypothetical protein
MENLLPFKYRAVISDSMPCSLCESDNSDDLRKCKKCHLLFHSKCVNASIPTRSVAEWKCPNCEEEIKILQNYGRVLEENKKLKLAIDKLKQNQADMTKLKDLEEKVHLLSEQNRAFCAQSQEFCNQNEDLKRTIEKLEADNSVLEEEKCALNESKYNCPDTSMEFLANTLSNTLRENSENFSKLAEKLLASQKPVEDVSSTANNYKSHLMKECVKDLPVFYGAPKYWPPFKKAFIETSKVGGFSKFENMCRLKKALRGPAHDLVERLLDDPSNIKAVLQMLERRFGDTRVIFNELKQKVLHCKPAKSNNDDLISLNTAIGNLIETMKAVNAEVYLSDASLVEDIIRKLPEPLQDKWYDKVESEVNENNSDDEDSEDYLNISLVRNVNTYTVNDIYKFMRSAVNCANYKASSVQPSTSKPKVLYANNGYNRTENMKTYPNGKWQNNKPSKYCFYCKSREHFAFDCRKFTQLSLKERQDVVQDRKICQSCLKSSKHETSRCYTKKVCGKNDCKELHHPLLHTETSSSVATASHSGTVQKP